MFLSGSLFSLDSEKIFQIFWSFKKLINLTCTYFNKQKTSYIWAIYMQHCNFTVLVDNCRSRSIKNHQFYTTSVLYCEKLEKEKSWFWNELRMNFIRKILRTGPPFCFSFLILLLYSALVWQLISPEQWNASVCLRVLHSIPCSISGNLSLP